MHEMNINTLHRLKKDNDAMSWVIRVHLGYDVKVTVERYTFKVDKDIQQEMYEKQMERNKRRMISLGIKEFEE